MVETNNSKRGSLAPIEEISLPATRMNAGGRNLAQSQQSKTATAQPRSRNVLAEKKSMPRNADVKDQISFEMDAYGMDHAANSRQKVAQQLRYREMPSVATSHTRLSTKSQGRSQNALSGARVSKGLLTDSRSQRMQPVRASGSWKIVEEGPIPMFET